MVPEVPQDASHHGDTERVAVPSEQNREFRFAQAMRMPSYE
jgi:hypothetical protein